MPPLRSRGGGILWRPRSRTACLNCPSTVRRPADATAMEDRSTI